MPSNLCVVCRQPSTRVRVHQNRWFRVCDEHHGLTDEELVEQARPPAKGSPEMFHVRAKLAASVRADPDGDYADLRRDLAFETLYHRIETAMMVEGLTDEHRERLAKMFSD